MGKDFDNHRRIIEGGDNLQSAGKLSRKRFQGKTCDPMARPKPRIERLNRMQMMSGYLELLNGT